jgi:hypothetical protein
MNKRYRDYFVAFSTLTALAAAACAPMTEAEREAREYAIVEFQNQFVLDQSACQARGGRIEVGGDAVRLDRNGVPYSKTRYICVLPRS